MIDKLRIFISSSSPHHRTKHSPVNMTTAKQRISKKSLLLPTLVTIISVLAIACSNSENSVIPDQKKDYGLIHVEPNLSATIDLQSKINAYRSSSVRISLYPQYGVLSQPTKSTLQYKPSPDITEALDVFKLAFYDANNTLLAEDSLQVIISTDTSACLLYARGDYVYNVHGPVEIDVLANDLLCNDTSAVFVELTTFQDPLYTGQQPPYYGTAKVLDSKKILYTPEADFAGSDKFIYRIYRKEKDTNAPTYFYAMVHFAPRDCADSMILKDDSFTVKISDIQKSGSILLPVNNNDSFCTDAANDFGIAIEGSLKGSANFDQDYNILYTAPQGLHAGDTDTFLYQLCIDEQCKAAIVTITFQ